VTARRASRKKPPSGGDAYRVVLRDARGRFTSKRPAKITVKRPGKRDVTVRTREQAARVLMPNLGPYAQRREFDAVIRQVRGRVLKSTSIPNVTFKQLLGPLQGDTFRGKSGGDRLLPPGLRKNQMVTARVVVERHAPDGTVISESTTIARAMRDEIVPKIASVLGFTDAEKARLFAGPSGGAAAEAFEVDAGLSFRDRQGVLDRRGVPRLSLRVEILG